MQKTKKIIDIVIVIFSALGIFMTCLYIYVFITDKGIYTNSTSIYVSSVTDPLTGEKCHHLKLTILLTLTEAEKKLWSLELDDTQTNERQQFILGAISWYMMITETAPYTTMIALMAIVGSPGIYMMKLTIKECKRHFTI